jgi:RNA polymerase sigma-70 factor (ECF subfamily)
MALRDREVDWAAAMRAANRGCARSYAWLLRDIAAALREVGTRDLARFRFGSGDVEDVVQECLLAIHQKRHTWDERRPIVPWVRAIARHKAIDRVRQRVRAAEVPLDDQLPAAPESADRPAPAALARHIAELPPRQRDVVRSLALEGASVGETARRLAMSTGAVRVAMHRGLAALALKLGSRS